MLIERKQEVFKTLDENYAIIRDEDWEILCLLWRDDDWYFVYSWVEYRFTKAEAEALLDKAAWVAITPVVDKKIAKHYEEELGENKEKIRKQIENSYFEEDE